MTTATLFIISAPSGAGKTSLVNTLVKTIPNIVVSTSYTTRAKRTKEREGVDYHYISIDAFTQKLNAGDFLEHANVFGNFYGTSQGKIQHYLNQGNDVILEIDWQGAQQIREKISHVISIFILPPSRAILLQRLQTRGQDTKEIIEQRTQVASIEIAHHDEFDYLIVNDEFNTALEQFKTIIMATRLHHSVQLTKLHGLLNELLQPI